MKNPKVFGIGFHKTGTTSLAVALQHLGYDVTGPNGIHDIDIADDIEQMVFSLADKHDAFQDNPWPLYYKQLDQRYPGSKFILTIRPTNKWIISITKYFGNKITPMRKLIYGEEFGAPVGNEQVYIERYEQHNNDVLSYFNNRPDDLLVFSLTEGDGWEQLCSFLGTSVPDISFPHKNKVTEQDQHTSALRQFANRVARTLSR